MPERCDFTDLPADQCAHCRPPVRSDRIARESAPIVARFPGACGDCGQWIKEGDLIAALRVEDNIDRWGHAEPTTCDRAEVSG